jgi:PAS domain S-box-containing protein
MRKRQQSGTGSVHWLSLILVVALLVLTVVQLVAMQRQRLQASVEQQTRTDIKLLRSFVYDALRKQDYQSIGTLLQDWGEIREDTLGIRVVAANGFEIAQFRRERPGAKSLRLRQEIPYAYKGVASLELIRDVSPLESNIARLRIELGAVAGAVALTIGILLWINLLRKRNAVLLHQRSQELARANERMRAATRNAGHLQAYLENVLDSIPSILIGVDAEGNVINWNKGAEDVTHIKSQDAHGMLFSELLTHLNGQGETILWAIADHEPRRLPRIPSVAEGVMRYHEVTVYPLTGEAGTGALIRMEDVTQQVRFERMMLQTEKLTALAGLATGVAHEINSPISGVLQNCQNVMRRLSPDLEPNRQAAAAVGVNLERLQVYLEHRDIPNYLNLIRDAAERAGRIVADMQAFSWQSARGFDKVAVNELIETAVRLASSDYELKKNTGLGRVEIVRELARDLPLLHCDRIRIEQVLLNLIRNAAQAMADANTPCPRRISLRAKRNSHHVILEVEDNGPGMTEDTRRRVFEPFFTTGYACSGTGLGLSLVYLVVTEQHCGSIDVVSAPNRGSLFTIHLPISPDRRATTAGFSSNQ